uniref:Uncharacterized protein n=1 Tax=Lygus hesperus TaxID=30085 RepID=A0A146KZT6_LYGHE
MRGHAERSTPAVAVRASCAEGSDLLQLQDRRDKTRQAAQTLSHATHPLYVSAQLLYKACLLPATHTTHYRHAHTKQCMKQAVLTTTHTAAYRLQHRCDCTRQEEVPAATSAEVQQDQLAHVSR